MRLLLLLFVVVRSSLVRAEPAGGVVLLHRSGAAEREIPLFDALRIYTRDLGRSATMGPEAPGTLSSTDLEEVAKYGRQAGAEVVVWFGGRIESPRLFALEVASLDLRTTDVADGDLDGAARTLALKVRALLTHGVRAAEAEWTPIAASVGSPPVVVSVGSIAAVTRVVAQPPAAPSTAIVAPSASTTAPPTDARPTTAPSIAPATASAASPSLAIRSTAPPMTRSEGWIEAIAAYQIGGPIDSAWLRQGVSVRLAAPLRRAPLAPFVDVALTTRPSVALAEGTIEVSDVPIGVGLAARWRRSRWLVDGGPRASLHILDVKGTTPSGLTGSQRRYTAGLGALGEAVYFITDRLGISVSLIAEALVPRQQFALSPPHVAVADLGAFQLAGSAGLLLVVP